MGSRQGTGPRSRRCLNLSVAVLLVTVSFAISRPATAAQVAEEPAQAQSTQAPTPLSQPVKEAEENNPQILSASREWRAATQVPSQASTLPDPQNTVQQFGVGSPRPFAGFSNSDFAYIGVGVCQDLPYPGKRRPRGESARSEAYTVNQLADAVRRAVIKRG